MNEGLIFSVGFIFLLALGFSGLLRKFKIPSITAYIFLGISLGPIGFNIVDNQLLKGADVISTIVLSIIAFSLGQNLSKDNFSKMGRDIFYLSLFESLGAAILVGLGVYIITGDVFFSLALASIASATSPTSVVMVVRELNIKGKFVEVLLGTVALDDLWSLIVFALVLTVIRSISAGFLFFAYRLLIEIAGAFVLGIFMGWLLAFFSKMISSRSELLILTLGFILFSAGSAIFLNLSALLSSLVMSASVSNFSDESFKFFDSIRSIDSPLYLIFFVLAGAKFQFEGLSAMMLIISAYIILRMAGKMSGVYIGGIFADIPERTRKHLGFALAPQAGVNMGLAIILSNAYPDPVMGNIILSLVVGTTIIFELFGPLLTRYSLLKSRAV